VGTQFDFRNEQCRIEHDMGASDIVLKVTFLPYPISVMRPLKKYIRQDRNAHVCVWVRVCVHVRVSAHVYVQFHATDIYQWTWIWTLMDMNIFERNFFISAISLLGHWVRPISEQT
jgi:hypothetical protein